MKNELKKVWKLHWRSQRITRRLADLGIKVDFKKHLDKITDTQWCWGGHLKDGKCHYTNRWEVSGSTYALKELLSKWGLKWDAGSRCWWIANKPGLSGIDIGARILKVGSKRGVFSS